MNYYEKKVIVLLQIIVFTLFVLFCAPFAKAEEIGIVDELDKLTDYFIDYRNEWAGEYKFIIGYGINRVNFNVDFNKDEKRGTLSEDSYSPFISLYSPVTFFENSSAGYFFKADFSFFESDDQRIEVVEGGSELEKMGTSGNGYAGYIMPVLCYDYWGIRSGIGLGLGYIRADGNIYIYDANNNKELHEFNISNFGMATGVLIFEKPYANFLVKLEGFGPVVEKGDYEYSQIFITLRMGYVF
jgi:hypothetical protein